jgi:hypothetical protein
MSGGWSDMTLLAGASGLEGRVGHLDLLMEKGTREETTQRLNGDTNSTPPQVASPRLQQCSAHTATLLHAPIRQESLPNPQRPTPPPHHLRTRAQRQHHRARLGGQSAVCAHVQARAGRTTAAGAKRRWALPCQQILRVRRIQITGLRK